MCTTLPPVLITVMGIEKVLPAWRDLEVFLQLLPRSSTGERMNPYTSLWSGVSDGDGPGEFHLVLLDNGRTQVLADEVGREALHCIRCSACLNACPVYTRVGGHAYRSVYPGPIGAVLTPQLHGVPGDYDDLPWASSLCGACYEVCPVKIDIPTVLVHLRGRVVREAKSRWSPERVAMDALARVFRTRGGYERAQRLARLGNGPFTQLPGPLSRWTAMRDLPAVPRESFREWWAGRADSDERGLDRADTAGRSHGGPPAAAGGRSAAPGGGTSAAGGRTSAPGAGTPADGGGTSAAGRAAASPRPSSAGGPAA
jgi:L-lactate dehydrogenase complex protein LldF